MISWLQLNFQKHFRVVFIVLLFAMIFTLVAAIGNQGNFMGGGNNASEERRFFEVELNTQAKYSQFQRDAQLSAFLSGNMRVGQLYMFERATALHIANLHSLPGPNPEQLEAFIKTRPIFQGIGGTFDPQAYNMMLDNVMLGGGATEADIAKIIADDYRIEKVYELLKGPGFLGEGEILSALSQQATRYSILTASFDLTTYNPDFELTDEELKEYYDYNGSSYETPARRSVEYVEFNAAGFVSKVTHTDDDLINHFEANLAKYQPTPAPTPEGEEAEPVEPITFEEARSAVRADYRLEKAVDLATERAYDLVAKIIDEDVSASSTALDEAIASLSLEKKTSANFASNEMPIGTTWGPTLVNQAFLLTEGKFYSEPIQHGTTSIVLFYKDEIPSIIPSFETLKAQIAVDLRGERLRELRVEHGTEVKAQLAENATSEEAFGLYAEENGFSTADYRDFSLSEPAEGLNQSLLSTVLELDALEVSDMIKLSESEGVFVYLLSKDTPEVTAEDEQYQQTKDSLQNFYDQYTTAQYIQNLLGPEMIRSGFGGPTVAN